MEEAFVDAAVAGVPLVALVFGIVAVIKKFGVGGKALLACSLGTGLVFGVLYMVWKLRPPVDPDWWVQFTYWFANVVYGLGLGLLASGVYEGVKAAVLSVFNMVTDEDEKPAPEADPEYQAWLAGQFTEGEG